MINDTQLIWSGLIESIGLTIVDTVWQGLLIGFVLYLLLSFTSRNLSGIRYRLSMLALLVMFAWAAYSFVGHYRQSVGPIAFVDMSVIYDAGLDTTDRLGGKKGPLFLLESFLHRNASFIAGLWLCGIFLLCLRLSGGVLYVRQLRGKSAEIFDPFWLEQMRELSKRVGIHKMPRLLESAQVSTPMTLGYLRPVIILPVGMLTGIPTAQLESILVHELVHIKKADYLINIFQSFIEIIFFYHPATWFISQMIDRERESRCDQITVGLIDNPLPYARALTAINQINLSKNPKLAMSAHSNGDLTRRIFRILNMESPKSHKNRIFAALLVLFLSVGFFSFYTPEKLRVQKQVISQMGHPDQIAEKATVSTYSQDTVERTERRVENAEEILAGLRGTKKLIKKIDTISPASQNHTNIMLKTEHGDTTFKTPSPIYYVDGKRVDKNEIIYLHPSMIKSIDVLKGEKATEKYGEEGENGVVSIYTKSGDPDLLEMMKKDATEKMLKEKKEQHQQKFMFFADEMHVDSGEIKLGGKVRIEKADKVRSGAKLIVTDNTGKNPLVIIDGQESDLDLESLEKELPPEEIKSMNVLKGPSAIAIYGKKGANGVILITTKKKASSTESDIRTSAEPVIYPNPSSGVLNIRFKLDKRSKVNVRVYNLNGKLIDKVMKKSFDQGFHTIKWETGDVPSGNYILHLDTGKELIKKQFLIEK